MKPFLPQKGMLFLVTKKELQKQKDKVRQWTEDKEGGST